MTSRTQVTNPEVKHWHGRRLMPQVEQVMLFQEGFGPQERRCSLGKGQDHSAGWSPAKVSARDGTAGALLDPALLLAVPLRPSLRC